MPLTAGTRLGVYEITAAIGAGGMGEVYRARDTKLGRDVALKFLPDAFAHDAERLARFQREAHVLASLNHPHIAAIYGLEDASAAPFLVMELVEGEDLSGRIARGAIPLGEALPIAKQIAEALEAAHDQGIIHRDLKPANIKLKADGTVKVLDFGLAKLTQASGSGAQGPGELSQSPTITSPAQMTGTGVVLGTAAYMAPEQAKGRAVDKRADVWAFGAVLFEMLTGRRCFQGDDVSDTFAAILRAAPEWSALPRDTPPAIARLLRRSLEKDVRLRLSDMAMARLELREAETEPREVPTAPAPVLQRTSLLRRLAPYAAVVVVALASGWIGWRVREPVAEPRPLVRFSIDLPDLIQLSGTGRSPVAISPDGTHVAYVANNRIYHRALDRLDATPIAGTEAGGPAGFGRSPFFSPDGQWIAFWQQNEIKKVAVGGGAPVTICEAPNPVGASWSADGHILLGGLGGIAWVPATGGKAESLIAMKDGGRASSPQLLPGNEWLLFGFFAAGATIEQGQAVVQSRTTGERRVLMEGVRDVQYVASGHLVYGRGNTLLAQAFDPTRLAVSGGPVPILDGVANAAGLTSLMHAAVSSTGTLIYAPGVTNSATAGTRLVQITREGTRSLLTDIAGMTWFPRYSPDGSRVAYGVSGGEGTNDLSDLWVLDLARGARTRVTFTGNNRFYPLWTRDSTRLTFGDSSLQTNRIIWTLADGSGGTQTLLDVGSRRFPTSWSPDGRALAFYMGGSGSAGVSASNVTRDIWMLTREGDKWTPKPFVETPFEERGAIFSPNGKWVAYVSSKSGQNDIYARPYPGPGGEVTISVGGGQEPVWDPSGKELFYRHEGKLWVVRIGETATSLTVGSPSSVFDDPYRRDTAGAAGGVANYDISPDGKRFVMIEEPKTTTTAAGPPIARLNVILNWFEELKRRAPAGN